MPTGAAEQNRPANVGCVRRINGEQAKGEFYVPLATSGGKAVVPGRRS
jgi:hypothetical protein